MSNSIKVYDKAKYHYESDDFPGDVSADQAYVHTGFFWGWLMDHGLVGDEMKGDLADVLERFRRREITGPRALALVGGALVSDMLSSEGVHFADAYFDFEKGDFLKDYADVLASGLPSQYHVADTWENYDKIKRRVGARYADWKTARG